MNKNNDVLLSFIIPVYNVELYLNECIDSIKNQMNNCCEIILVNDGSTDSSGDICVDYSKNDKRIKCIHQKNQGAAAARNLGLLNAKGKYVTFVDSDDRIASDSVEKICSWIISNDCDLCFMQMAKLYPDGTTEDIGELLQKDYIRNKSHSDVIAYLASRPKFSGSACNKIYRKDFLLDNKVFFPEDGLVCEDLVFVRDALIAGEKFDFLDFPYYLYRQMRKGSVTNNIDLNYFKATARFIEESSQIFTENRLPLNSMYKNAMSFVAYEYIVILWQFHFLSDYENEFAYEWLKNYSWVLKYAQNKKGKLVHCFIRLFGIKFTVKLLGVYKK